MCESRWGLLSAEGDLEMKTTETEQWLYLIVFTVVGVITFGLLYLFAATTIPPAKDVRDYYAGVVHFVEESLPAQNQVRVVIPPPGEVYKDIFSLQIDKTTPIGDYLVIYKGFESHGRFKLDVANTRLDAKTFYSYTFAEDDIARGIRIGDERFRVLSARRAVLHLHRIIQP